MTKEQFIKATKSFPNSYELYVNDPYSGELRPIMSVDIARYNKKGPLVISLEQEVV